ncbi:MAG: methyltransferase domain-containing protein [Spirochaetota bacterium]|nr:methyltransferase domain-containing protein [Spirochaetota bacterium]
MNRAKEQFLSIIKSDKIKQNVIHAFMNFEQKDFFDPIFKKNYYTNESIPIGFGEMSDPLITLLKMISYLSPKKKFRILEIGTGSGYSTAILSSLVQEIVTVEYHERLAGKAKERLKQLKIDNVRVFYGDGARFDKGMGIFDAVIIWAACSRRPITLIEHIKDKGLIVFPMGPVHQQQITILRNEGDEESDQMFKITFHDFCTFTPLKGVYGID